MANIIPIQKGERLKRNKRANHASRVYINQRDKDIILAVYENRFLRREQIERIFFFDSSTSACNRRLKKLYQQKLLERIFQPVSFGHSQAIYALDTRGANLLAKEFGIEKPSLSWKKKDNRVRFMFLEHTLAINDFKIALELAIKERNDVELLFWKRESKELNDRVPDPAGKRNYLTVIPDAFFGIKTPEGKSYFFLEMDMGTESNQRFAGKIVAYKQYWKTGKYTERYGFKSFRVLTVTTSEQRLENLQSITYKASGRNMFLFATRGKITESKILNRIWITPTSDSMISIL